MASLSLKHTRQIAKALYESRRANIASGNAWRILCKKVCDENVRTDYRERFYQICINGYEGNHEDVSKHIQNLIEQA